MILENYSLHYERFHPDTAEHTDAMIQHMAGEIGSLLPEDKTGAVLDIGCGFGFAMLALKRLGFNDVRGVDIDPQQVERAKRNGLDAETVLDTTAWLSDRAQRFSTILLFDVLEHIPVDGQIGITRAIYRALRPGGRLILQVPNANAMLAARWRYIDHTHHSSFTEHSLEYVLRSAGFSQLQFDAEKGMWFSKRIWKAACRKQLRKYLVRWFWLQVFKAELPHETLEKISFELNLKAIAIKEPSREIPMSFLTKSLESA